MDAAKILIAEDESIIALDIKNILEKRGFNIIGIAYSGKESISLAEKHTPDIVLMDIILEGEIDGITAAEEIKARYNIPIIYLTAHSDENTLNRAKATEPYGYILKPLNENEMYSTLVTALYKHELEMKLKESEIRYRTLFQNAKNGVAIFQAVNSGEDFVFVDINNAGEHIDRIKREETIGKSILEVFPGIREFGLFDIIQNVWRTGNPRNYPPARYEDDRISGWRENYVYKLPSGEIIIIYDDITEKKQTEDALRQSEEKYRLVVENANEGIVIIQNGAIKFSNDKAIKIIGYSIGELERTPFFEMVHPDDREIAMEYHGKRMKGKEVPELYEMRILDKNMQIKWLQMSVVRIEWEQEPAALAFMTDITKRKRSEEELRESESKFRALTESIPAAIFIVQDDTFRYVNPAFEAVLGYRFEEIEGKSFLDIIHPDFRELVKLTNEGRMRGDTVPSRYGFKIITKNGTEKWIDNSATVIMYENRPAVLGSAFDITEQKRAEDELRVTGEKFSKAFFSSPAMMNISHYKEGRYLDVNESLLKHTGYNSEEIVGKTIAELDIFPNEEQLSRYLETLKRDGKVKDFEIDYRTKSGEIRTEIVSAETFRMEGVKYQLGSSIDITERKRAEEKIREQYEEIQGQYEELEAINEELTSVHNELIEANERLTEEKKRLSFTLRSIVEGVITTDSQGRVNMINSAAENITGWKQSEAEGKPISDVLNFNNEQSGQSYDNAISSILNSGKVVELKQGITIAARDGTLRSIAASGSPIRDMQKKIIGIIMVIRDLSEREK